MFLFKEKSLRQSVLKKRLWHRCFPVRFLKFLRTLFFHGTPMVAASVHTIKYLTLYNIFVWSGQTNKHKTFEKRKLLCEAIVKISYEISSNRTNNYPNHLIQVQLSAEEFIFKCTWHEDIFPNFRLYFTEFLLFFWDFNRRSNRKQHLHMLLLKSEETLMKNVRGINQF